MLYSYDVWWLPLWPWRVGSGREIEGNEYNSTEMELLIKSVDLLLNSRSWLDNVCLCSAGCFET